MRQRLLHEGVLAHPHTVRGDERVTMVGRANRKSVDLVAQLSEHFAVIENLLSVGPADRRRVSPIVVHIADGNDIASLARVLRVFGSLARHADAGELNLLVRGPAFARGDAAEYPVTGADGGRCLKEA